MNDQQPAIGEPTVQPRLPQKPLHKRLMQLIRRGHLYVGLFLFPWAILYGVTGFLFNHPTFFSEAPSVSFTRSDLVGTPLEVAPTPAEQATQILAAMNEQNAAGTPYTMGDTAPHYANRDSFIVNVKVDSRSFFVVYDPNTASGVIRETTTRTVAEKAPFATGANDPPRQRGMGMAGPMKHNPSGLKVNDTIIDRIKLTVPQLMEKKGFPSGGEMNVTAAPDIKFPVQVAGEVWTAVYNPITTSVNGSKGPEQAELGVRTFLLRMHLTRGYPGEMTTKWFWAIGVDAIAIVLCFWGISGLMMWWQIKATRKLGAVVLATSAVIATTLAFNMYAVLSQ